MACAMKILFFFFVFLGIVVYETTARRDQVSAASEIVSGCELQRIDARACVGDLVDIGIGVNSMLPSTECCSAMANVTLAIRNGQGAQACSCAANQLNLTINLHTNLLILSCRNRPGGVGANVVLCRRYSLSPS